MNITYRRPDFQNHNEIMTIAAIDMAIPASHDVLYRVDPNATQTRFEKLLQLQNDFFEVVVTDQQTIIGFHIVVRNTSPHWESEAYVQTLWVAPEFRNQGIASKLKEHGEAWAKENNIAYIATFVQHENKPMRDINARMGYEVVGYRLRKKLT